MQGKLRSNYRVQVSRMMIAPSSVTDVVSDGTATASDPDDVPHARLLSCVTVDTSYPNAHSIFVSADSSLLPPRHRYYALLSSALSRLVRETRRNSYQPLQD